MNLYCKYSRSANIAYFLSFLPIFLFKFSADEFYLKLGRNVFTRSNNETKNIYLKKIHIISKFSKTENSIGVALIFLQHIATFLLKPCIYIFGDY